MTEKCDDEPNFLRAPKVSFRVTGFFLLRLASDFLLRPISTGQWSCIACPATYGKDSPWEIGLSPANSFITFWCSPRVVCSCLSLIIAPQPDGDSNAKGTEDFFLQCLARSTSVQPIQSYLLTSSEAYLMSTRKIGTAGGIWCCACHSHSSLLFNYQFIIFTSLIIVSKPIKIIFSIIILLIFYLKLSLIKAKYSTFSFIWSLLSRWTWY